MSEITKEIGYPALLEQMAEECAEMNQACLKLARKLRAENPTPRSISELVDNLIEESADVLACFNEMFDAGVIPENDVTNTATEKIIRWHERLNIDI